MKILGIFLFLSIVRLGTSKNDYSMDIAGPATVVNVLTFGAVGDGVTDDSIAFGKAWAAVCAAETGMCTLLVPAGKTFFLKPVTFSGPCKCNKIRFQIDGNIVAPGSPSAWAGMDQRFWILYEKVDGLVVSGNGQIDGRGATWWKTCGNGCMRPTALSFYYCNHLEINGLKSIDSQRNHITIYNCTSAFISNIQINAPKMSPNTDGIDISHSTFVRVSDSFIGTGDDCIAIETGCSNINITGIQCGPGHGISVGSLGQGAPASVEEVNVQNCNFTETLNGVRIKTFQGGSGYARKITFQDISVTATYNPIVINQKYEDVNLAMSNEDVQISDVSFIGVKGTSSGPTAISLQCSASVGCTNIQLQHVFIVPADKNKSVAASCLNAHGTVVDTIPNVTCLQPPRSYNHPDLKPAYHQEDLWTISHPRY